MKPQGDSFNGLKAERVQDRFLDLDGWVLLKKWNREICEEEPTAVWTAFELTDHLEACELVAEIGAIADTCCATPEIDVRGNVVFVTAKSSKDGLTEEDFDFAEAIDLDLGTGQRQKTLLNR